MIIGAVNEQEMRSLLIYQPSTGLLIWKPRPRRMFKSRQAFSAWNTKYSGKIAGYRRKRYFRLTIHGKTVLAHRICFVLGNKISLTAGQRIDHRDGDGFNNRKRNLRLASSSQNSWNAKGHVRDLPKNVILYKPTGRYCAYFRANRKTIYLGYFPTSAAAATALRRARNKHHGEFARHS